MNKENLKYRKADLFDLEKLISLRKKQLIDEGIEPSIEIDDELYQFFQSHLKDHSLVEWLLEDNGEIIATSAILFMDFPPTYTNQSGKKGYITNMYTAPEWRHQGIASTMLELLAREARSRGISKLWLGASKLGRPVYEKFGFVCTSQWMDLDLDKG